MNRQIAFPPSGRPLTVRSACFHVPAGGRPTYLPDALLSLSPGGRLDRLRPALRDDRPDLDLSGRLVIPALIDLHTHVCQYRAVARHGPALLPWLERHIFPAEAAFAGEESARLTRRFLGDQLRSGVTTSCLYTSPRAEACETLFGEAESLGLRVIAGPTLMDRRVPPPLLRTTRECLDSATDLCARWHGRRGRIFFAFTPRFALACSPQLMASAAAAAAERGAFIQTHLSESPGEIERLREIFPDAPDYAAVYDRAGLLGPRTIVAHCLHLSESEWQVLARRACTIAHCPRSNFHLKSGVFQARKALESGMAVGLGTDVAAGGSVDLFDEMRAALWASAARALLGGSPSSALTPAEVFAMATSGAARGLGLPGVTGDLSAGACAHLVALDAAQLMGTPTDPATLSAEDVATALVVRGAACAVRTVILGNDDGTTVHEFPGP